MTEHWVLLRYEGAVDRDRWYTAGEIAAVSAVRWVSYKGKTDNGHGIPEGWVLVAEGTQEEMQALEKLTGVNK